MLEPENATARRKREQKERKAQKRAAKTLVRAIAGDSAPSVTHTKELLTAIGIREVRSEECEQCLARQGPRQRPAA